VLFLLAAAALAVLLEAGSNDQFRDAMDGLVLASNVEPEMVQELQEEEDLRGLEFVRGDYHSELSLERASVRKARKVVIIADTLESSSVSEVDSKTVMAVLARGW
jgi:voltage-gated potassium channel